MATADALVQQLVTDAEALRALGVEEGQAVAAQAYFGQSAIRLTVGLFAAALNEAAAMMQAVSPDAATFFAAKAREFAEFANPPKVMSISPASDAANVQVSDQVVLRFSAALDAATVTTDTVTVAPSSGGPHLNADVVYDDLHTVTLIPHNGFSPGVAYTVTVAKTVRSRVGQILGTDYVSHFTTI